jgi:4-amino-4-deoxy-L-arabinose transferase-like glycosyltransferase
MKNEKNAPPLPKEAREQNVLWAILFVAALLVVGFALMIPADAETKNTLYKGLNPDEDAHFKYVKLLIENHGFVRFPFDAPEYQADYAEAHQPPLYYWLCIPFYLLSGGSLLVVRLVNLPIHLATIWAAFRAGRNIWPERREIALGLAGFVAFLPTQLQLAGAVNNDPLATFLGVMLFWKLLRVMQKGPSRAANLWVGGLLGLGLWTKLTFLQLIPIIALAYVFAQPRGLNLQKIKPVLVALGIGFAIAAPLLIRNTVLYGDPFCLAIFPKTAPPWTATPTTMAEFLGTGVSYVFYVAVRSFFTFFAILPPNSLAKPMPVVLLLLFGLLVAGGVGTFWKGDRRIFWLCKATLFVLFLFFVRFNLTYFQAQGRYFYTGLLPVGIFTIVGLSELSGKTAREWVVFGVCLLLLVLSIGQIATMDTIFLSKW